MEGGAMKLRTALCCWVLTSLLLCVPGSAQVTTGTLYGTVTDASASAVPAATITLIHDDTGTAASRISDASGEFGFDFLRVGTYTLRIEKPGFKKFESKN